jgi:hypothetical protein
VKLLREPLVHFLLIGGALYAAYAVTGPTTTSESPTTITVTAGEIEWLETTWLTRWNRPPTADEREGLVQQYVRETVLYREALAMGLDRDDVIIRRRLAQKLEFLFQDLADMREPTTEQLQAFFAEHTELYQEPEILTFAHVFVDPDRREGDTLVDAEAILAELQALSDPTEGASSHGDPFMLQAYYPERSESEVGKLFGHEFARSIFELDPGRWHGPVLSGYGVHLVFVHGREQFPLPNFESVRERVAQDWQDNAREAFNEEYTRKLIERYEIVIEDEPAGQAVPTR